MILEASQFLSGAGSPIYYFADTGSRMFWLHWLTAAICISVRTQILFGGGPTACGKTVDRLVLLVKRFDDKRLLSDVHKCRP